MGKKTKDKKRKRLHVLPPGTIIPDLGDDQVLSFREWCFLNSLSHRGGWRILHAPGGPVITQLSTHRIGITRRANRQWQETLVRSRSAA